MTDEEIVSGIQAGESELLHALWEQVQGFVAYKVKQTMTEIGQFGGVTFDDLYNSGYLAVEAAVKTYKESEGKFISWLAFYLRKAFAEASNYKTMRDKKDPIRSAASLSGHAGKEESDSVLSDFTPDPQAEAQLESIEDRIFAEQLREAVRAVLDDMPTEQSAVIRKRYLEGLTQEQTGQELGVDKNEVVRKEEAALRLLRRGRYASRLRPFYDYNYYSGTGLQSFLRTGISVQEKYVLAREKFEQKAARATEREDSI